MRHWSRFLFVGILVCTATTSAAVAETYRVPETGNPALVADAAPGWTGKYVAPNQMMISSADDLAILELETISDPEMAKEPLPDVAREVLRIADLSPRWTSTEPEQVAGLPGQAFIVPITRDGVPVGVARVILAKIDASHIAKLTEITLLKVTTPAQLAELNAMVSHLGISGR